MTTDRMVLWQVRGWLLSARDEPTLARLLEEYLQRTMTPEEREELNDPCCLHLGRCEADP